jgi:hypothetical protein
MEFAGFDRLSQQPPDRVCYVLLPIEVVLSEENTLLHPLQKNIF